MIFQKCCLMVTHGGGCCSVSLLEKILLWNFFPIVARGVEVNNSIRNIVFSVVSRFWPMAVDL